MIKLKTSPAIAMALALAVTAVNTMPASAAGYIPLGPKVYTPQPDLVTPQPALVVPQPNKTVVTPQPDTVISGPGNSPSSQIICHTKTIFGATLEKPNCFNWGGGVPVTGSATYVKNPPLTTIVQQPDLIVPQPDIVTPQPPTCKQYGVGHGGFGYYNC